MHCRNQCDHCFGKLFCIVSYAPVSANEPPLIFPKIKKKNDF